MSDLTLVPVPTDRKNGRPRALINPQSIAVVEVTYGWHTTDDQGVSLVVTLHSGRKLRVRDLAEDEDGEAAIAAWLATIGNVRHTS